MTVQPHPPWEAKPVDVAMARSLAEGCRVHGVGFICRHDEGDPDIDRRVDRFGLEGARARLAAALLSVVGVSPEVESEPRRSVAGPGGC